jgi:DNA-binding transcriptional LysR family regulator
MSPRLDSRSLELFLAVADTLSFRQAAETLHLSQPPLSRAIRELEERLGARLFDRGTQGVSLTDAGRKLLPYARSVGRLLREAEASLAHEGMPQSLRLGLTSAVEPAWFGGLAERIQASHPDTAVSVVVDTLSQTRAPTACRPIDGSFHRAAHGGLGS